LRLIGHQLRIILTMQGHTNIKTSKTCYWRKDRGKGRNEGKKKKNS